MKKRMINVLIVAVIVIMTIGFRSIGSYAAEDTYISDIAGVVDEAAAIGIEPSSMMAAQASGISFPWWLLIVATGSAAFFCYNSKLNMPEQ